MPLVTTLLGVKFHKTEAGAIWLDSATRDVPDGEVQRVFAREVTALV